MKKPVHIKRQGRLVYEGPFYARPLERGIVLGMVDQEVDFHSWDTFQVDLEEEIYDIMGKSYDISIGGYGKMKVSIEILEDNEDE